MFPRSYFSGSYFPATFYASGLSTNTRGGFWAEYYFAKNYFANSYFPGGGSIITADADIYQDGNTLSAAAQVYITAAASITQAANSVSGIINDRFPHSVRFVTDAEFETDMSASAIFDTSTAVSAIFDTLISSDAAFDTARGESAGFDTTRNLTATVKKEF